MIIESEQIHEYCVADFIDKNGRHACGTEATIIICCDSAGMAVPFTATRLGDSVELGDKFVVITTIRKAVSTNHKD